MLAKRSRPYAAAKYSSTSGCHRSLGLYVYRSGAAALVGLGQESICGWRREGLLEAIARRREDAEWGEKGGEAAQGDDAQRVWGLRGFLVFYTRFAWHGENMRKLDFIFSIL